MTAQLFRRTLARVAGFVLATSLSVVAVTLSGVMTSYACVGAGCIRIWSTADGGGKLTVQWDFSQPIESGFSFCTQDNSLCFYTTNSVGFMAPTSGDDPSAGYYILRDGTSVSVVLAADLDPGMVLQVGSRQLTKRGDSASLGTMLSTKPIHVHPQWNVILPGGQYRTFSVPYKLTTDSPLYTESDVFTQTVVNVPPDNTPTPTPVVSPTPACVGDCNSDGAVTVDEVLHGVDIVNNGGAATACPALDGNSDGVVDVDEVMQALDAALHGCPAPPVATLAEIQETIFTPKCAIPTCHDAVTHFEDLNLSDGVSASQLIGVASAESLMPRVDAGHPENSFLLVKVQGAPPTGQGEQMPLTGGPLTVDEIELIRTWILQGAPP